MIHIKQPKQLHPASTPERRRFWEASRKLAVGSLVAIRRITEGGGVGALVAFGRIVARDLGDMDGAHAPKLAVTFEVRFCCDAFR